MFVEVAGRVKFETAKPLPKPVVAFVKVKSRIAVDPDKKVLSTLNFSPPSFCGVVVIPVMSVAMLDTESAVALWADVAQAKSDVSGFCITGVNAVFAMSYPRVSPENDVGAVPSWLTSKSISIICVAPVGVMFKSVTSYSNTIPAFA